MGKRQERTVTAILASIWFAAVVMVVRSREEVPLYLLGIATVFFLMLIPSMKELVKSVERRFGRGAEPGDDDPV